MSHQDINAFSENQPRVEPTEQDTCLFMALMLRWNLTEPSTIIRWVDSIIMKRPSPPDWAIELSAPQRSRFEIVRLLKEFSGSCFPNNGASFFIALLRIWWISGEMSGSMIGRILYALLQEGHLPESAVNIVIGIDAGYDLSTQGYLDKNMPDENLRIFLEPYQQFEHIAAKLSGLVAIR